MANISKINVNNNEYKIKDAVARDALGTLIGSSAVPNELALKIGWSDYRTHTVVDGDTTTVSHYIYFYKQSSDVPQDSTAVPATYITRINAAPFIKDGMVRSVEISNGNLVITWNSDSTDAEENPTEIPLTDIFNPANYYDKDAIDGMIEDIEAGQIQVVDNLTTQDPSKALSANQGYVLDEKKANKSELSIAAVTGKTDRKNVQLKTGTSQEFLIAHQDISGKADKSSTVSNVAFDSTTGIISQTVNGESYPIITFDALPAANSKNAATSGGIYLKLQDKADKSEMSVTPGTGANSDKTTIQLKSDTSATVLTAHQSLVGYINEQSDMWNTVVTAASQVGNKVDKVTGKGLSTNDYTTAEKNKLAGLSNYDDTALAARVTDLEGRKRHFIELEHDNQGNPMLEDQDGNFLTAAEFIALMQRPDLHEVQMYYQMRVYYFDIRYDQGDCWRFWAVESARKRYMIVERNDETEFGLTFEIHNDMINASDIETGLEKQFMTQSEKDKLGGIAAGAQVNVKADWNAASGDAQILNKPTIPAAQVQSDWNQTTTTAKDFIKNKPTNVSAFTNDAGYQTSSQVTSAISSAVSGSYTASTETLSLTLPTFTTA